MKSCCIYAGMASLHRHKGCWYCAYRGPDGKRHFRNTHGEDQKKAWVTCRAWAAASELGLKGELTAPEAFNIVHRAVADIFKAATKQELKAPTVAEYADKWLKRRKTETAKTTCKRYSAVIDRWLKFIGPERQHVKLALIQTSELADFRDWMARNLSHSSAKTAVKVIKVFFNSAMDEQVIMHNPVATLKGPKQSKTAGGSTRKPFTFAQVQRVLKEVRGTEWEGMVLMGLYLGQRLGDLAMMKWGQIDLQKQEIHITTSKTGKELHIPIAKPLFEYLLKCDTPDDPAKPVFPKCCALAEVKTGTLSNQFAVHLADAGIIPPKTHDKTERAQGSGGARQLSPYSFHSLRHTATTWLKAAGASEAVAMAIIGHETPEMSRLYTKIPAETMAEALKEMPDVTKKAKAGK